MISRRSMLAVARASPSMRGAQTALQKGMKSMAAAVLRLRWMLNGEYTISILRQIGATIPMERCFMAAGITSSTDSTPMARWGATCIGGTLRVAI
jgi:hypothetical protein